MERYFKILGIPSTASKEEIKQAYYTKIKALHPDKIHGTALEDAATFLTAELNEAYDILMSQSGGDKTIVNPFGCIEEDIFIEGFGNLKYFLSNGLREIRRSIIQEVGVGFTDIDEALWEVNAGLSENVKKSMYAHGVEYSATMYYEGETQVIVINRYRHNKWYLVQFATEIKQSYLEEEIFLEGKKESFVYTLSNDISEIKRSVSDRIGISLNDVVPRLNPNLSANVKQVMDKHNVRFSMTAYYLGDDKEVVINERKKDGWYSVFFTEANGILHMRHHEKCERSAKNETSSHFGSQTEAETSTAKAGFFIGLINFLNVVLVYVNRDDIINHMGDDSFIFWVVWFVITFVLAIIGFFVSKSGYIKEDYNRGWGVAGMVFNGLVIIPALLFVLVSMSSGGINSSKKRDK